MESQQEQQLNEDNNGGGGGGGGGGVGAKGSFHCRQSSTRWTPTTDQIRILKGLYYNSGIRSPNTEQIQKISARLRQYGKIEGKSVFYWFQNHKARERQKKGFTTDSSPLQRRPVSSTSANWKPTEDYKHPSEFASASETPTGVLAVGRMGSVTMESSFRDCSISAGGNGGYGGSMNPNYGWVGMDSYGSSYTVLDKRKSTNETLEEEEEEEEDQEEEIEIETLPLFPTHCEDINGFCNIKRSSNFYHTSWYGPDEHGSHGSSCTSLELGLDTYTGDSPDSI